MGELFGRSARVGAAVVRFARVDGAVDDRLLTAVERVRRDRLRLERDRHAYTAAHLLVRECAAAWLRVDVAEVEVAQLCARCGGDHGAPYVVGRTDVAISLSHSGGYVAAIAAGGRCGVDVEELGPRRVVDGVLTAREQAWVAADPDPAAAFTRLWVRKEALVKAGSGDLGRLGDLDVLGGAGPVGALMLGEWSDDHAVGAWAAPPEFSRLGEFSRLPDISQS